ncbi:uncharacterized protein N7473_008032 [Penicillium subrubescens]|uniref:uncharacterized protein n=1 Tax=Penicillium subrubescens TaxID=1316194 RepID=UPI0025457D01|nr:uncharacterized protein N7473_008032 [Penicillium subrubescens]KAJ5891804.1 hypothetical protein N7473_008032 [Penicillium subrubescens]
MKEDGRQGSKMESIWSHGLKIPVLDITALPDEPWRTRQYFEAAQRARREPAVPYWLPGRTWYEEPGYPMSQGTESDIA